MPKANKKRPERVVIITEGSKPTIVVKANTESKLSSCTKIPVYMIDQSLVKDTNGAGDTFVGGFLAALAAGKKLHSAVECGQELAALVV